MTEQNPPHQNPQISIVLPTYNEADNIERLIDRTLQALSNYPDGVEVLVVDDDSPDGTWQRVAEKAQTEARVRLVHRTTEKGLTSAIRRGYRRVAGKERKGRGSEDPRRRLFFHKSL